MDLYGMCRRTHIRGLPQPTAPCYDTIWKNGNQQALVRMPTKFHQTIKKLFMTDPFMPA